MSLVDFRTAVEIFPEVENFQPPEWQDKFHQRRKIMTLLAKIFASGGEIQEWKTALIRFKDICTVDIEELSENDSLWKYFNDARFTEFPNSVRGNCPMLTSIIEIISIGDWTKYNTGKNHLCTSSRVQFKWC